MKKSSLLLGALLVVSSVAFAAEPAPTPQPNDTTGAKARRGLSDVGDSVRQMGRSARGVAHDLTHRDGRRHAVGTRNSAGYAGDTRTDMSGDSARRQRMDEAYTNWQAKR